MSLEKIVGGLAGDCIAYGVIGGTLVLGAAVAAPVVGVPLAVGVSLVASFVGTVAIVSSVARCVMNRFLDAFNAGFSTRFLTGLSATVIGVAAGSAVVAGLIAGGVVAVTLPGFALVATAFAITLTFPLIFLPIVVPCSFIALIGTELIMEN